MVLYPQNYFSITSSTGRKRNVPPQLLAIEVRAGASLAPREWVYLYSNELEINVKATRNNIANLLICHDFKLGFNLKYKKVKVKEAIELISH